MKRVVITVLGADRVGIIAAVTKVLAEQKINVLSINQTILDGFKNSLRISVKAWGWIFARNSPMCFIKCTACRRFYAGY